jgi:adenine-specific DNA-methyltransferase
MTAYSGRLELTWTNKPLRLLAHEDGSYEWVSPSDYRVAEVRLLNDVSSVGTIGKRRAAENLLIRGDALNALQSLAHLPEFASEYVGKVQLVYLDPPFNTQQSFLQYDDALEHSVWLTMMRDRLLQIRDLLAPDGSIWVHCDDSEQHRLRVVMDEVFGADRFVATVVWENRYSRSNDAGLSVSHNYLLVYSPSPGIWNRQRNRLPRSEEQAKQYRNPDNDPRGDWRAIPWDAPNIRENLSYPIATAAGSVRHPPPGRHWSRTEDQWKELVTSGLAYFGRNGDGAPSFKQYLSDASPIVPNTWWEHETTGHSDEAAKEIRALFPASQPFATPKPERLMHRIIHIASNPGEVVLDCFAGSGTTAAVAQKMGRRWIAVEREALTFATYALPRLRKVVAGEDPGGVTDLVGWAGGGGFRVLDVAPSMFHADAGLVFLADWMTNGKLAEATAAQLGYEYEADPPFSGRKGRTRLAVVDGVANESVVRLVVSALGDGERVVVCGTGIDTDARPILRELRPGSTLRKIPAALLDEYRSSRQLRFDLEGVGRPAGTNGDGSPAVEAKAWL